MSANLGFRIDLYLYGNFTVRKVTSMESGSALCSFHYHLVLSSRKSSLVCIFVPDMASDMADEGGLGERPYLSLITTN